jgi:exopolyphosphatase/pppGpp-phosphohydrolase
VYAAIDVGTNTVRLLLARAGAGKIAPVRYYRKITRLGGEGYRQQGLAPKLWADPFVIAEVSAILRARGYPARAVGTAALRDALNGRVHCQGPLRNRSALKL